MNAIAEESTEELIKQIEAKGEEVVAKGKKTLESIPEDYTVLEEKADELKEDLINLAENGLTKIVGKDFANFYFNTELKILKQGTSYVEPHLAFIPVIVGNTYFVSFTGDNVIERIAFADSDECEENLPLYDFYDFGNNIQTVSVIATHKYMVIYYGYKATEQPLGTYIANEYTFYAKYFKDSVYYPFPLERHGNTDKSNDAVYINKYLYPRGLIKSITTINNGDSETNVFICIINKNDNTVVHTTTAKINSGMHEIPVNFYVPCECYIGISGLNLSFINVAKTDIGYFVITRNKVYNGAILDIEWSTGPILSVAISVKYDNSSNDVYNKKTLVSANRMFASGDSITAGYPLYTEHERWWEVVSRKNNYICESASMSGSGFAFWQANHSAMQFAHDTDFNNYDVAFFAYGTNDYGNNIPIGEFSDNVEYSVNCDATLYGAVKYVIETVKNSNKECLLILSLPINRCDKGSFETNWGYGTPNAIGKTLKDYNDAIINVCDYYGVPYISHEKGAFDRYSIETLLSDKLHPTRKGYRILAQEMCAKLNNIIVPYDEYIN